MDPILQAVAALVPSIGVGLIFWYVMRVIIQADRRERAALARADAEESEHGQHTQRTRHAQHAELARQEQGSAGSAADGVR